MSTHNPRESLSSSRTPTRERAQASALSSDPQNIYLTFRKMPHSTSMPRTALNLTALNLTAAALALMDTDATSDASAIALAAVATVARLTLSTLKLI